MNRRVWLMATLAVAMLFTTNVGAETAAEVVAKIRDGIDPHDSIEVWEITITFPDNPRKPGKQLILAKKIEGDGDSSRADFLTPESEEGNSEHSHAFVGLRYLTKLSHGKIVAVGTLYQPSRRTTRVVQPPPMKPVLPDLPVPFFWLSLHGYLAKYSKWGMEGNAVFTLPPPENSLEKGNPRGLPKLRIEFFEKEETYLISKLVIDQDGDRYLLSFEGYGEIREGEFRPRAIIASGRDGGKVRATIDAAWYWGTSAPYAAIFSLGGFKDEMLSPAQLFDGHEVAEKRR